MKKLIYLFMGLITCGSVVRADPPAIHGMLLFGGQVTYASHLPMFHSPHDYQLVLKLNLKDQANGGTVAAYEDAKKLKPDLFTLVPEAMDLTKVISGAKSSFSAALYKGHFEHGGQKLGEVQVQVEKIVFSAKLNGLGAPSENKYLVFGDKGEYFALHLIQGKPNFDAVLSVSQPYKLSQTLCNKRFCPEAPMVPIADSQLPMT